MNTVNISDKSVRDNLFSIIIVLCVCLSDSGFTNVLVRQPSQIEEYMCIHYKYLLYLF